MEHGKSLHLKLSRARRNGRWTAGSSGLFFKLPMVSPSRPRGVPAEIFNILNHANFAPPTMPDNTDIFDQTGALSDVAGELSRTTTTAREVQFAVKIIW